jgi:hypothetical protein
VPPMRITPQVLLRLFPALRKKRAIQRKPVLPGQHPLAGKLDPAWIFQRGFSLRSLSLPTAVETHS